MSSINAPSGPLPRNGRHLDRRSEVARAAWKVIGSAGLKGASMREIAREAGCSTGVLSHYFRDKEELLEYAFEIAVARVWERTVASARHGSGIDTLVAVLTEALPLDDESRLEVSVYLSFLASAAHDRRRGDEMRRRLDEWRQLVGSVIEADPNGATHPETRALASHLLAAVDGLSARAIAEPERFPPERQRALVRHIAETALDRT